MCSDYRFSNQVIPNPYQITKQNLTYILTKTERTQQIDCLENTIKSKGILFDIKEVYFT